MENNYGKLLYDKRKELFLTQDEVAVEAGILKQQYQRYESGITDFMNCKLKTGLRICRILQLDPADFVLGSDDMSPPLKQE